MRQDFAKSAAWSSGKESSFYDGHDRKINGLTPTQVSLLRPYIRCFTIISTRWNLTSSKVKSEAKPKWKTRKQQIASESGFALCIVPPSLSRDKKK